MNSPTDLAANLTRPPPPPPPPIDHNAVCDSSSSLDLSESDNMGANHSTTSGQASASQSATIGLDEARQDCSHQEESQHNDNHRKSNLVSGGRAMRKSTSKFIRNGSLKLKSTIKLPCRSSTSPKTIINKMIGSIHHDTHGSTGRAANGHHAADHHHQAHQAHKRSTVTFATAENPPDQSLQQQLHERRRKSLKNGDVFIYPPIVRRLNECHRCSRDNKICDCNCNSVTTSDKSLVDNCESIYANDSSGRSTEESGLGSASIESKAEPESPQLSSNQPSPSTRNCVTTSKDTTTTTTNTSQRLDNRRQLPAPPQPPRTNNLSTINQQQQQQQQQNLALSGRASGEADKFATQYGANEIHMRPTPTRTSPLSCCSGDELAAPGPQVAAGLAHGQELGQRRKPVTGTLSMNEHLLPNPVTSGAEIRVRDSGIGSESSCSSRSDSIRGTSEARNEISETTNGRQEDPVTATRASGGTIANRNQRTIRNVHSEFSDREDAELGVGGIESSSFEGDEERIGPPEGSSSDARTKVGRLEAPEFLDCPSIDEDEDTLIKRKSNGLDRSTETIIATIDYNNNNNNNNSNNNSNNNEQQISSYESCSPERKSLNMVITYEPRDESPSQLTCVDVTLDPANSSIDLAALESNGSEPLDLDKSHTSVIPMQNVSARRRNLVSKLSRQAIHEDYDEDKFALATTIEMAAPPVSKLVVVPDAAATELQQQIRDSDSSGSGCNDALEYSPILSSVRDYIANVNTEIQFKTSPTPSNNCDNLIEVPITISSSSLVDVVDQTGGSLLCGGGAGGAGGSICNSGYGSSSSSNTITLTAQNSTSMDAVQTIASIASSVDPLTTAAIITTSQSSIMLPRKELLDSPKRSIFDGASKDEILEYLEDARERVPEVLIAADDVMVINENELIVVNQLEPNSPATPISIVESVEIIDSEKCADLLKCDTTNIAATNNTATATSTTGVTSPLISNNAADWHHQARLDSNCDSFDVLTGTSNQDTSINQSLSSSSRNAAEARNHLKNYSFQTETTMDSIEDQALGVDNLNELVGDNPPPTSAAAAAALADTQGLQSDQHQQQQQQQQLQQQRQLHYQHQQLIRQYHRSSLKRQFIKDQSTTSSNASNKSLSETSNGSAAMCALPFIIPRSPIYAGRRNSTSGGTPSSALQRDRSLQLGRVNRDSLSSSSSSPPSSTSPSSASNSSSNRTSGECSATSNFYASSSLSSSSPFIAALNRVSPNSPAFGRSMTPVCSNQPPTHRYYNYTTTTTTTTSTAIITGTATRGQSAAIPVTGSAALAKDYQLTDGLEAESMGMRECRAIQLDIDPVNSNGLTARELLDGNNVNINIDANVAQLGQRLLLAIAAETPAKTAAADQLGKCFEMRDGGAKVNMSNANEMPTPVACFTEPRQPISFKPGAPMVALKISNGTKTTTANSNNLMAARSSHGHHATISKLNNYLVNRQHSSGELVIEFQCLDCDQFIYADQAVLMHKTNEMRQLRVSEMPFSMSLHDQGSLTADQLDRAYIAAMNGLPLCKSCDKKRVERKEIISEFVETELKYGHDLKIIHDEFYRPMQIAGLLSKDQINGIFLNLDELIMAHCRFADRLGSAINEARALGDQDYNTVNIGKIFVESAEMLHTFESYCIRQGSAACLLARLAKEKELLRIFLRVSQMENTLLRRMNLAAFLMVPVQRVTKYPLLLNRLYKVTAYHHKDREALRDAQLKVELHLEHINQQTKGVGASNKIWRRISNLSAPISAHRRGLINTEDIGYMKLRKTAMDMLKWNRDETQFIHSGKLNFAPLNEHLTKQKMKPIRYMASHALLIVLGKPNWKYRPDLVKSTLDNKLMIPTPEGNGIREAALLLFREKNNRYVPCREPLFLSNCVLSNDCSQYNSECPPLQACQTASSASASSSSSSSSNNHRTTNQSMAQSNHQLSVNNSNGANGNGGGNNNGVAVGLAAYANSANGAARRSISGSGDSRDRGGGSGAITTTSSAAAVTADCRPASAEFTNGHHLALHQSVTNVGASKSLVNQPKGNMPQASGSGEALIGGGGGGGCKLAHDTVSMSSLKSLPENQVSAMTTSFVPPPIQAPRSFSLASALPRAPITTSGQAAHLNKSTSSTSSNLTILNQLMTKVNSYHHKQSAASGQSVKSAQLAAAAAAATNSVNETSKNRVVSPNSNDSGNDSSASKQSISHRDGSLDSHLSTTSFTLATSTSTSTNSNYNPSRSSSISQMSGGSLGPLAEVQQQQHYSHHYFNNHHHQPYGDYEESFEIHERLSKESMLLRADTPLKTRYWLQMLRYHAKDLGQWRSRRNALSNIMVMRQEKWTDPSTASTSSMASGSSSSMADCGGGGGGGSGLKKDVGAGCQQQDC